MVLTAMGLFAAACSDSSGDAPTSESAPASTASVDDTTATTSAPSATTEAGSSFEGELVGIFQIDPASCAGADVEGSYFRMIQPQGDLVEGPFVPNADSSCEDTTYTPMAAGSDGGLVTGTYQPAPDPPFNDAGDGLSARIVEPATFFAVAFAIATDDEGKVPTISATDGVLSGDLSAWTAYYGNLIFLQGAPLPDGSMPGLTSAVTGTIDPESGGFVLEWSSQIEGGSFNDFTGVWHLEGTFKNSD
ncbi:MAG: hypothetical protein ACC652_04320 [Acidimicrobiales bacterium]